MSLRKQLKTVRENSEKRHEERVREEESKLVRSDTDWQIVEGYLEDQLKEEVANPYSLTKLALRPGKYAKVDRRRPFGTYFAMDNKGNFLTLSDGSEFQINHKDIQRFCEQHNLKLLYQLKVRGETTISRKFNKVLTDKYLIKV